MILTTWKVVIVSMAIEQTMSCSKSCHGSACVNGGVSESDRVSNFNICTVCCCEPNFSLLLLILGTNTALEQALL
jgi:hypothetical protein